MNEESVREEQLREAACVGDVEALNKLIQHGVNVNSKNAINGWSALHWGCKRGRLEAVRLLLAAGADVSVTNSSGQQPAELTKNRPILQLLGVEPTEGESPPDVSPAAGTPSFQPSYLTYPAFSVDLTPSRLPNGDSGAAGEPTPAPPNGSLERPPAEPAAPAAVPVVPVTPAVTGLVCCSCRDRQRPVKGAIPDDELVLKVRVAGVPAEADFVELQLPLSELTFDRLLRECCRELNIDGQVIDRVRKLPNTLVRRDSDVRRLTDYQELELVVRGTRPAPAPAAAPATHSAPAGPFSRPIVY
ncbi:ankyrin repeat domain-containing protein 40-like [Amphibalanus amphitrite]|uniref:ankyrin repeat domain-containing protein 40-like n=1 Tax=Amphibalanus amphitrite TaxID=1232801 RepID=UPI001C915A54|nr:ankyrin repeat domain-containing protein 40-like [Amphibalanus amphitrite]